MDVHEFLRIHSLIIIIWVWPRYRTRSDQTPNSHRVTTSLRQNPDDDDTKKKQKKTKKTTLGVYSATQKTFKKCQFYVRKSFNTAH